MSPIKAMKTIKKAERLNQELIFLKNKHSFQLQDLMSEFHISKRTAIRDVQELENMGLAVYTEQGRGGSYKLLDQNLLTPIYFNNQEIQAIFFAIKALDLVSSTPFESSYPQIRKKLLETLPEDKKKQVNKILEVVSYHHVSPVKEVENLVILLEAILNQHALQITYTQFVVERKYLQLFNLFYRSGVWFCHAYDMEARKFGVYRCDYMLEIIVTNTYQGYSEQELSLLFQEYEEKVDGIEFKCELTEYGRELFLKRHYPSMELLLENNKIYIKGSYKEEHAEFMVQYLISLGKHVKVMAPGHLKEAYKNELKEIINMYD